MAMERPEFRVRQRQTKPGKRAEFVFTLVAVNGEPIASGEGYLDKGEALDMRNVLLDTLHKARVVDQTQQKKRRRVS